MSEPRIVSQQDGLYRYVVYEDMEQRWWKIHRPGDETPDYYDEYDGDLIADLLSWLHAQRDKAEAERDALRAEVERLRGALTAICAMHDTYAADPELIDVELEYEAVAKIAWDALAQEASE